MPHGHDRLLVPSVPRDQAISGLQGGAVLAHGPQPGLNQRAAQVPIAFAGFAASTLSRTSFWLEETNPRSSCNLRSDRVFAEDRSHVRSSTAPGLYRLDTDERRNAQDRQIDAGIGANLLACLTCDRL